MFNFPSISIVTPTWQRHKNLITCIEQVKNQNFSLPYEHIIISDGFDEEVEIICSYYNISCKCIDKERDPQKSKGHLARDTGINMALGEFIVLWDDDNIYYADALSTLYTAVNNFDIGVCNINFRLPPNGTLFSRKSNQIYCTLPNKWDGNFYLRQIDTMNVIIRKSIAVSVKWTDSKEYEGDFYWLAALQKRRAKINYLSKHIGIKI
jgi:glycosyltransferase involved in cell wall biosynthesis